MSADGFMEHQAGQVGVCAREGGAASVVPLTLPPYGLLDRLTEAHRRAGQAEVDFGRRGNPGEGYLLLGRASYIGLAFATSPAQAIASAEKLLAELRSLHARAT